MTQENSSWKCYLSHHCESFAKGKLRYVFLKRDEKKTESERSHIASVIKDNEAFTRLEIIKERMITFFDVDTETEAVQILSEIEAWVK